MSRAHRATGPPPPLLAANNTRLPPCPPATVQVWVLDAALTAVARLPVPPPTGIAFSALMHGLAALQQPIESPEVAVQVAREAGMPEGGCWTQGLMAWH